MPIDWTEIEEGDSLSATTLNTKFTEVTGELNDLPELSIQPRSLHAPHLPSMVVASASTTIGDSGTIYQNSYPGWKDDTWTSTHLVIGVNGWTTLKDSTKTLQVPFSTVDLTDSQVAGVLIMANCQVTDLDGLTPLGLVQVPTTRVYGFFKLQVQTADTGVWVSIARSEVYIDSETQNNSDSGSPTHASAQKDVPLRAFVTYEDVASWGNTVFQARVVHCVKSRKATAFAQSTVHRCNLSVLALYGKSTVTS